MGFIISGITITIIIGCLIGGEIYLRNQEEKVPDDKDKDDFPQNLQLLTHDGKKISDEGNLKFITDPFTIYKNLPNQKTEFWNTNSLGFRGREITPDKNGGKRIIVVGGSAAFGTSVGNDNYTIQAYLENINPGCEVINAGVQGFLSGQELTYIVTELVDYKPDIIIAYDGWNDLYFQWNYMQWFGREKGARELGYNSNLYIKNIENKLVDNYRASTNILYCFKPLIQRFQRLMRKSILLEKVKLKINNLKSSSRKPGFSEANNTKKEEGKNKYFNNIVLNYTNNLVKMDKFCRINNICFLVVIQPEMGNKTNKTDYEKVVLSRWNNYSNYFPSLYKKFLEESKKILKTNNVNYLDINSSPELINSQESLFRDAVHTNKRCNQIIAAVIDYYLRTALECSPITGALSHKK